ncbi:MAG: DUF3486 family protein [Nitrosomonadales bacterium]|nr:DUF3486 family protein [Nitrosomonadales bacterium]
MPKRNACSILPKDIRLQLHQSLVDSNLGDFEYHSDLLKSLGHSISKSTIHRYCQKHGDEIRSSVLLSDHDKFMYDIRMRCLEVSSGFAEGDFDQLFKKADVMLNWVKLA